MKRIITWALALIVLSGCTRDRTSQQPPIHLNPNMDVQERYEAQGSSEFFADGSAMRMPVEGTIARGQLHDDDPVFYTGRDKSGKLVKTSPMPSTMANIRRGQDRYNIFCAPCHGKTGEGNGMISKRGFQPPPTPIHDERLITIEDGHIFEVLSNGVRNMPAYRSQISAKDRWAIVAFVRALQRSQNASISDIPEEMRDKVQ